MPYELCRHVKTNGTRCLSPALTGEMWCFFHERLISRHRNLSAYKKDKPPNIIQFPALEDRESVQVALSLVADAIITGVLHEKRATLVLRAISLASRNAASIVTQPHSPDKVVRSSMPTLDGFQLAPRCMNDFSKLPELPPKRGSFQPESAAPTNSPAAPSTTV